MINIFHRSREFLEKHKQHHHLFLAVLALVVAGTGAYTFRHEIAQAATYTFTQASWADVSSPDTVSTASHANQVVAGTPWTKYYSASSTISIGASDISLQSTGYSFVDGTATSTDSPDAVGGGFSNGAFSSTIVSGASVALALVPQTVDVSKGHYTTCILKADGTVFCWGYNSVGQLGDNTVTQRTTPVQVHGVGDSGMLEGIVDIDNGKYATCAVKTDGTAYCWGENGSGQLGNASTTDSYVPVQVHGVGNSGMLAGVTNITVGDANACALKTDGTAYCWGIGGYGQNGDNTTTQRTTPVQVHGVGDSGMLTGVSKISAGGGGTSDLNAYTCAVKTDGTAYCWGRNPYGNLGDNTVTQRTTPVQVHGVGNSGMLTGVADIETGEYATCAIKTDGTAYCWGYNNNGQLGDNTVTQRTTPVQVHGVGDSGMLANVSKISRPPELTAGYTTCALKTEGTVFCWGINSAGALGNASTTASYTPVQVHGVGDSGFLTGVNRIGTGIGSSCAIKTDGTAYCWGSNTNGQLGINSTTQSTTPVQVHGVGDSGTLSLFTPAYYSSGTFTSAAIDFARPTVFTTMSWTATLNSQTMTMRVRSAANSDMSDATAWGSCGDITSGSTMSSGNCVTNGDRYIQYQATLNTGNTAVTPTLDGVTINDTQFSTGGGTLISSKYDTGSDANLIKRITWTGSATSTTGETISFQVRSASTAGDLDTAPWCGYADTGTCTGSNYFYDAPTAGFGNGVDIAGTHPLRSDGNDRWFQYRAELASAGAVSPILNSVTMQYVVNAAPEVQNPTAVQNADGTVTVHFDMRDIDTDDVANVTQNRVISTLQYNSAACGAGPSWSDAITVDPSGDVGASVPITPDYPTSASSTITWTPTTDWNDKYCATQQFRIKLNDQEGANNLGYSTTGSFLLDTTVPDITSAVIDSSAGASTAVGNTVGTITFSITDSSDKQYRFCNNSSFTSPDAQGNSCGWSTLASTVSGVATSTWVFMGNSADEAVYMQARDAYGNVTARTIVAPAMPANFQFTDASNVSTGVYREFLSWAPFVATTSSTFASYNLYHSLDGSTYGSPLVTITASTTNYYAHTIESSTSSLHYYKLTTVNNNGDISNFTGAQSDIPDGSGSVDTTPPYITSIATSSVRNTSANITFSTFTDSSIATGELATSTIEYSTQASGDYASSVISNTYVVNHSVYLTDLTPSTTYVFRVKAKDIAGNVSSPVSGGAFTTLGGPKITGVTEREITDTSATIFWNTESSSDSKVCYSTTTSGASSCATSVTGAVVTTSGTNANGTFYQHQVGVGISTPLVSGVTYYYKVVSADAVDPALISTDDNNGQYYSFVTLKDTSPPVISATSTPVLAPDSAVVVWQTSEPATTKVDYGLTSSYGSTSEDTSTNLSIYHVRALTSLTADTLYYYRVTSKDAANNTATADGTFRTAVDGSATITYVYIRPAGGDENDTTPPLVSSVVVSDITPFSAVVKFSTDEDADAFVEHGKDVTYENTAGDKTWAREHTVKLRGLTLGTEYHIKVTAHDKAGNTGTSADQTFKTTFLSENLKDMANVENIEQFQKEIENAIESILPSLVPPFVTKPIVDDITESGAKVSFKSNIKAFPVVVFAEDGAFDETKESPYIGEVSDTTEKATSHELLLTGLKGNTKYHIQARAFSLPKVLGKSVDVTFITKASKIAGSVVERKKDSFTVVWTTDQPTSTIVEYKDLKRGVTNRKTDDAKKTSHSMKIENLPSGTAYEVNLSGLTEAGNIAEAGSPLSVTTSTDVTPPAISGFKVDNALVPGRTDRIQTIVSWVTDEPSNSTAFYQEGAGTPGDTEELANKNEILDSYVLSHSVILPSLKPGTIYRLKVTSMDDSGNEGSFGPRTVITPKQTESITDIIFKNFEDSFKFLRKI